MAQRIAEINRGTRETKIHLKLDLDGNGESVIDTGIPFLDHMLELFAKHGLFDLEVKAEGDIDVDDFLVLLQLNLLQVHLLLSQLVRVQLL